MLNPGKNNQFTVAAQGPVEQLQPYLGYVVQFPLATPIPVRPGQVVALTVGTWAPVLSYNLASKYYSYRQSRSFNCKTVGTQQNAVTAVGQTKSFACSYPGTRAEYSATEVTNPVVAIAAWLAPSGRPWGLPGRVVEKRAYMDGFSTRPRWRSRPPLLAKPAPECRARPPR